MRLKEKQTFLRTGFPFLTNQIFQRFVDLAGGGAEVSAREAYDPQNLFHGMQIIVLMFQKKMAPLT